VIDIRARRAEIDDGSMTAEDPARPMKELLDSKDLAPVRESGATFPPEQILLDPPKTARA
jgi:hypothetical protein